MSATGQGRPLAGKVTGAARRLGRAIASAFAEAGADVAITYRNSEIDAADTWGAMYELGAKAMSLPCDIRSETSIQDAVSTTVEEFGRLDILVNNAGIFAAQPLESITVEQWDDLFATNTRGPFLVGKIAHPHLKASRGRILNLGSLGGLKPWATHAHYCASKAALHMLSQTMAKAWAPEISVNCIAPGMIVSPGEEADPAYRHFADRTPMRRNGTPADVAAAALIIATCPPFITGQILAVDGGLSL